MEINGQPLQLTDVRAFLGNEVLSIRPGFPHVILVAYDPIEKKWITVCLPMDPTTSGPVYDINVWRSLAYIGELPGDESGPQLNWMLSEVKKIGWIFCRLEMNQDDYQPGESVAGQFQGGFSKVLPSCTVKNETGFEARSSRLVVPNLKNL